MFYVRENYSLLPIFTSVALNFFFNPQISSNSPSKLITLDLSIRYSLDFVNASKNSVNFKMVTNKIFKSVSNTLESFNLEPSFCKISSLLPVSAQVEKLNCLEIGSLSYEINKYQKQSFCCTDISYGCWRLFVLVTTQGRILPRQGGAGTTELRTFFSKITNSANSKLGELFEQRERRTVRTVHIVRTVRTVHIGRTVRRTNRANSSFFKIVEQDEQCEGRTGRTVPF